MNRHNSIHPPKKLIRITTVPISLRVLLKRQLRFMSAWFDVLAVSSPGADLKEVALQEKVRTAPVLMTRSVTPLQDMMALCKLTWLFVKERPHIVHTHTPKAGLLGMMAAWLARVPVRMHTVAGLPLMESRGLKRMVLELTERITYSCATSVYPNSMSLAAFIRSRKFCRNGKLKVLGNGSSNGIDMDYFRLTPDIVSAAKSLRKELRISDDDFVFLFIGRLVKDKGIEELVEAFLGLKADYRHVKLLLVGPFEQDLDPLSKGVQKTIQTDKDIIHTGFQSDIRPYLAISHVLTFPSYREGFPNVPMQAGCFNIPAIVTDINGCNEIITHEKNGLVVPVKQAAPLRDAMEVLLTNQPLYVTLKTNARRMIRERYNQKQFWNLLLAEYYQQLKSHTLVP